MRILFVVFNLEIGGAEWVTVNLCNEFVKEGEKVVLLTNRDAFLLSYLSKDVEVNFCRFQGVLSVLDIAAYLRMPGGFDVVFGTQRNTASLLSMAHYLVRSPAALVIREAASNFATSFDSATRFKRGILRFLHVSAYRRAHLLIANSAGTRASLEENDLCGRGGRIITIENPVDINHVRNSARKPLPRWFRNRRRSRADSKLVVSIGRLEPQKRMADVIEAVGRINHKGRKVDLIILGEGTERPRLERLVDEIGLQNSVCLPGKLTNPYPVLNSADVFALASEFEGFGMVLVEALALGVPVVAADIPDGPQAILGNGEFGGLFKVGDIQELAFEINQSLDHPGDPSVLRARAEEYGAARKATEYLHHFEELDARLAGNDRV